MEIDILYQQYPYDKELLDGIYDLILETVLCKSGNVIIASNEYPVQLVKSKFLKLNSSHIQYVMDCLKETTSKVRNIKKYLLAALFNAPSTMKSYYLSNRRLSQVISADYIRWKYLSQSAVNEVKAFYIGWHRRLSRAYFSSAMAGLK